MNVRKFIKVRIAVANLVTERLEEEDPLLAAVLKSAIWALDHHTRPLRSSLTPHGQAP
jgi:hypothetical protein